MRARLKYIVNVTLPVMSYRNPVPVSLARLCMIWMGLFLLLVKNDVRAQLQANIYMQLGSGVAGSDLSLGSTSFSYYYPFSYWGGSMYSVNNVFYPNPGYLIFYQNNQSMLPGLSAGVIYPVTQAGVTDNAFVGPYITYKNSSNTVTFTARWIYVMPTPVKINEGYWPSGSVCANQQFSLRSDYNPALIQDAYADVKAIFEYRYSDGNWTPFDSVNYLDLPVIPVNKFPALATQKKSIQFRYRIRARYATAVYYSAYSPETGFKEFLPAPPKLAAASVAHTDACYGEANGTISVPDGAVTGGFTQKRWILRRGNVTDPCNPSIPNSNCGNLVDWSEDLEPMSQGFSITGLSADTYTLWVVNPGDDAGNCFTPIVITIKQLDQLAISQTSLQNVSCYNGSDGAIGVSASGGNTSGPYYFTLLSGTTIVRARQAGTGNTMSWQGLPAGTYTARMENGSCAGKSEINITITQPPQILGVASFTPPTCVSPGNGSAMATGSVPAGFTKPPFIFKLYKEGIQIDQSAAITGDTYSFTNLAGGNYKIEIINADYPLCQGWSQSATLATLNPLDLQLTGRDSVSCFGGSDGRLQLSATGGTNLYSYTLGTTTNTTGLFTGLTAGTYTIKLKNQDATCNDEITKSFDVFQRSALGVVLQKTDITCNNADNGILKAVVSGGSGSYKYGWQQLKNGVWTTNSIWFNTDQQIEALQPGTYRVVITDDKASGCTVTSSQVVLDNPTAVQITNVSIREAVCLADGAGMTMTGTGGDGNYTYTWSLDGTN
ncbi:hypothetical protein GO493_30605, partial [Chitinophaga sp. ysch24]|nr:hypothetical protein [Chitinophaga tropicalis]